MTFDEAIKNNEEHSEHHRIDPYPDYFKALQLGIEALKRCRYIAEHTARWAGVLLAGETKE